MAFRRRIFVSVPADRWLTASQLEFKKQIILQIKDAGYIVESFFEEGESENMVWSFDNVQRIIGKCVGAVILAFPRWNFNQADTSVSFATEYTHYEGAIINSVKIPCITFAGDSVLRRGAIDLNAGKIVYRMPDIDVVEWSKTEEFTRPFKKWLTDLGKRYDLFLGYCSKSKSVATEIEIFLTKKLDLKVKNWAIDFVGGTSILSEIEKADSECTGGIFLFTKDDQFESDQPIAAPRDNVIFEAGYFIRSKGKERVIVIREKDAKMPADLGGDIYLHLEDKNNISTIETKLRDFIENRL